MMSNNRIIFDILQAFHNINRIHVQIYDQFVITGSHFADIVMGQTRRFVFPDCNNVAVTGKLRFNDDNETSSLVLNVDEMDKNCFFISITRKNNIIGNIQYSGASILNLNNQFNISETGMRMLYNERCPLHHSKTFNIEIGEGEMTRLDFRVNAGPYFAVAFGSTGPIICRANGNVGIPALQDLVRAEAENRLHERANLITREYVTRFLWETPNLPHETEELLTAIFRYTGVDRFLRH